MTHKVILHPAAAREAEQAYRYIAQRAPENASRWYNRLLDAMFSLADFPRRCPLAPESRYLKREIRHLIHGNYRILYTIEKRTVRILHVRHAAMRPIGEISSDLSQE